MNEQVKRNADRFPEDFMFQLTSNERSNLKSQFSTSSLKGRGKEGDASNRSQIATGSSEAIEKEGGAPKRSQIVAGSRRHRDPRFMPYAFIEHGAIMAASVLNSPEAVAMSVFVVRAVWQNLQPLLAPPPDPPKRKIGFNYKGEGE